jgi:hypothetical protein
MQMESPVFIRQAPAEEVAAPPFDGHAVGIDAAELREPLLHLLAHGDAAEERLRVLDLSVQPRARLGAVLIFQPAIGIGDRNTVQGIGHRMHRRWRRTLRSPEPGNGQSEGEQTADHPPRITPSGARFSVLLSASADSSGPSALKFVSQTTGHTRLPASESRSG